VTTSAPSGPPPEIVIISGMSGAGRSTAARHLEDLGWFVVDNLPPGLLATLADLGQRTNGDVNRIAAVIDVRSRRFFADLEASLAQLHSRGIALRQVYLEASDDELVRRFESVRRPHPLQGDGRISDGIAAERELLRDLRGDADLVVDTTSLNVHELRAKIDDAFTSDAQPSLRATVISFGYKYGLPVDADLVVDCRFIPNPFWVPGLRAQTGLDDDVRDYVFAQPGAEEFVDRYAALLGVVADGYRREGKRYVTLAVGCTGGKHRSVAVAEQLGDRLRGAGVEAKVVHRDLGRE
jgi:RNase adapter protein RapZ